jgi:hypothetical protein
LFTSFFGFAGGWLDLYPERVVDVTAFLNLTSTWSLATKLGIELMKLVKQLGFDWHTLK